MDKGEAKKARLTAGPWHTNGAVVANFAGEVVAHVATDDGFERAMTNARVLAAAFDLMVAAELVADNFAVFPGGGIMINDKASARTALRVLAAALERAKGGAR
jgi:hypothetical protein